MGKSNGEITGRVKRKGVYFNLDDEDEAILYKKANEIRNFSKWVKKCLINDGVKEVNLVQNKSERKKIEKDDLDDIMI